MADPSAQPGPTPLLASVLAGLTRAHDVPLSARSSASGRKGDAIALSAPLLPQQSRRCESKEFGAFRERVEAVMAEKKWAERRGTHGHTAVECEYDRRRYDTGGSVHAPPVVRDGALAIVFNWYAALQTPHGQLMRAPLSYDEVRLCNESMSSYEMLQMLRDFDVIPQLVSKQDLGIVWRLTARRHNTGKSNNSNSAGTTRGDAPAGYALHLPQFLDALCRLALLSWPDAPPTEALDRMVAHMRLDEAGHARKVVRVRGRETQRKLYFRSKGERSKENHALLLAERKAEAERNLRRAGRLPQASASGLPDEDGFVAPLSARASPRPVSAVSAVPSTARSGKARSTAVTTVMSSAGGGGAMTLSAEQEKALSGYSTGLALRLEPHLVDECAHDWVAYPGSFLNFGSVQRYAAGTAEAKSYLARILVRNVSAAYVSVSVTTNGLGKGTCVSYAPSAFAPGMSRVVRIELTPLAGPAGEVSGEIVVTMTTRAPAKANAAARVAAKADSKAAAKLSRRQARAAEAARDGKAESKDAALPTPPSSPPSPPPPPPRDGGRRFDLDLGAVAAAPQPCGRADTDTLVVPVYYLALVDRQTSQARRSQVTPDSFMPAAAARMGRTPEHSRDSLRASRNAGAAGVGASRNGSAIRNWMADANHVVDDPAAYLERGHGHHRDRPSAQTPRTEAKGEDSDSSGDENDFRD